MLGEPQQIAADVRTNENNGRSAFTVSSKGILVYRTGDQSQSGVLTWFDRSGKMLGRVAESGARYSPGGGLLPDERHVVAHVHDDERFLMVHPADATNTDVPLTVVVNWTSLLSQK